MDDTDDAVVATLRAMPKVDLHRHLEGSIPLDTLAELLPVESDPAARASLAAADGDRTAAARAFFCITEPVESLTECMDRFSRLQAVFLSAQVIARVTEDVVMAAAHDGVVLLELRYSPGYIAPACGLSLEEIHAAVIAGLDACADAAATAGLVAVGLIGIIDRFQTEEKALELATFLSSAPRVVGIDLANDETTYCDALFLDAFKTARDAGLSVTIHAGEVADPRSASWVVRAVEAQGAARIGHGIHVMDDPYAIAHCKAAGAVFEVCPTSNVRTSAVASLQDHPVRAMIDAGLAVVLASDDPGLFDYTLTDELVAVVRHCGLSIADVAASMLVALDASFLPPTPLFDPIRDTLAVHAATMQ